MRKWLIAIREDAGLSQAVVAERANISQPTYSLLEKGMRNPSVRTAKNIGSFLGFEWQRFYEDDEGSSTELASSPAP